MAARYPKIINNSPYRGDDLRRLTNKAVDTCGAHSKVPWVDFRESSEYHGTGLYHVDDCHIAVMIPKGLRNNVRDRTEVCQILVHELGHALGLDHPEMKSWWKIPVSWAKSLTLRRRVDKKLSQKQQRLEHQMRDTAYKLTDTD